MKAKRLQRKADEAAARAATLLASRQMIAAAVDEEKADSLRRQARRSAYRSIWQQRD